jgi:hypothetical protein
MEKLNQDNQAKSQVFDTPDNWGLWLHVNTWGHVRYLQVIEKDDKFYARTVEALIPCEEIGGQWIHVFPESKETKLIDIDTLKRLDDSLIRHGKLWDKSHIAGWDHAFDVIYNWMKGQTNAIAKENKTQPGCLQR